MVVQLLARLDNMFAVPGWNVAAKSIVQEQAKPVKEKHKQSSSHGDSAPGSKKRKREDLETKKGPKSVSDRRSKGSTGNDSKRLSLLQSGPRAEHNDSDHGTKRRSRGGSRKADAITGANAEPVGSPRTRIAAKQPSVPPHDSRNGNTGRTSSANQHNESAKSVGRPSKHAENHDAKMTSLPPIPPASTSLTPLQAKMRAKLTSARFRHLNETLYTSSSADALYLFGNSPDLFAEYHAGFSQQVKDSWPQNPVDVYLKDIKNRGSSTPVNNESPLPRRKPGACTLADLGCGDAPLARGLQSVIQKLNLKIYSFDLHAPNAQVTIADISALPLRDGEVDVAIFCLSLMGTNWLSFVEEAWRVLRGDGKGEVWVAEVKSRFGRISARKDSRHVVENSVGRRRKTPVSSKSRPGEAGEDQNPALAEDERDADKPGADDDTDLQPFIESFGRRGLVLKEGSVNRANKMFVSMIFTKTGVPKAGKWKGMKWNGKEYQRMEERKIGQQKHYQGARREVSDEEIDEAEEGKLLKPCVYKLR